MALVVHQHLTVLVKGDGEGLSGSQTVVDFLLIGFLVPAVLTLQILQIVVRVLENALVAETIDGAKRVVQLDAIHVTATACGCPITVDSVKHTVVHLFQQVGVLGYIQADVHRELLDVDNLLGTDIHFPTVVIHATDVHPRNIGETGH